MSKKVREELQRDHDYVNDIRWRLDRAHRRIDELTVVLAQKTKENKILQDCFESLNIKYELLKKQTKENMNKLKPADLAIAFLELTKNEFKKNYPAPYEYPSEAGRVSQLIEDSINTLKIIKQKEQS
jgi:hypothetical protein